MLSFLYARQAFQERHRLFGTNFDVMDANAVRHLMFCAEIWMCCGKSMNLMVMDVGGIDQWERGEDQVRSCSRLALQHCGANRYTT